MTLTFEDAAAKVKTLKASPSNDQMLELYALYKQSTVGDNTTDQPGMLDVKGKAKWSAWNGKKGKKIVFLPSKIYGTTRTFGKNKIA
ncbi:acyl CoA binding protein [Ancylostoma duodenale]|uniref:Acyl CoA binding protein n=1 Tax=Ancylostoma duodenale TaxID=51022 RepID=A0A0C2CF98_9BILA|nr:acyl CoA binding protein [Ancylostoma duodenale]